MHKHHLKKNIGMVCLLLVNRKTLAINSKTFVGATYQEGGNLNQEYLQAQIVEALEKFNW